MSLWWARKDQLDQDQVRLIEELSIEGNYLVLGPPGSGKTNVLLRRAQFVRTQGVPNVLVLTFTRPLTEFLRTGCVNGHVEIFPRSLVTTVESWIREMYRSQKVPLPVDENFLRRKRLVASGALDLLPGLKRPKYDAIFVDEAQDLIPEEVQLLGAVADRLFFVGDDRQQIFEVDGLAAVRAGVPHLQEEALQFHYRLAPEICAMADRILSAGGVRKLAETSHYDGPKPGRITTRKGNRDDLPSLAVDVLKAQLRVYGDMIREGDRLGVVVPTNEARATVLEALSADDELADSFQEVRARSGDASDVHDPTLDPARPILVMTEPACKGLEFRALHWLYVDENAHYRTEERYYTVVTRAKSSLDIYYSSELPGPIAKSYSEPAEDIWA